MMSRKELFVKKINLKPHPEGGFYREMYRSNHSVPAEYLGDGFPGPRSLSTGIYYLLGAGDFSAFHRIKSDEMWHFYEGDAITIHIIHTDGLYQALHLGRNVEREQTFQLVVPAGAWFAAELQADTEVNPQAFGLVGCTVSPGFDFEDFEMADGYMLKNAFPEHKEIIDRLVR